MKRKIYNDILKWKNESNGSTALLIEGARRVGKSYIVEEFAKENYKSYILIDFSKAPEEVKSLFDNYLDNNTKTITNILMSINANVRLFREEKITQDEKAGFGVCVRCKCQTGFCCAGKSLENLKVFFR